MNRTPEITKEQFALLQRIENGESICREQCGVAGAFIDNRKYASWNFVSMDTTMKLAMDLYEARLLIKRLLHD